MSQFEELELKKSRISDQITDLLKKAISEGKLHSGEKLPPEKDIAAQFKVSKVAVRESLRQLETEGLIKKQRGAFGGSYLSEPGLARIGESVNNSYKYGSLTLGEITEFRQILEPAIMKLASERITEEELKALEQNIEECEKAIENGAPDLSKQIEFHCMIARTCHNTLISAVIEAVTKVFEETIGHNAPKENIIKDLDYSKKIYDCLLHGDVEGARELLIAHFDFTRELIKRTQAT